MRQRRHALSGALYEVRDDGCVDVTARDGTMGTFTADGQWLRGELRHADPHLCGWLAGPQLPPRLAVLPRFRTTQASGEATSGEASTDESNQTGARR